VFVPSFTFAATAEVVALVGATPVFVDVHQDTRNKDAASLDAAVGWARRNGLRPSAVIPVDLFGLPADYRVIGAVASQHGLLVLADAAQSYGALYHGRRAVALAEIAATSFFPAKPLGCYGDGGAIFTDDDELARRLRSIRVHGQGSNKYDNVAIGFNARLDTLQAAILLVKHTIFAEELEARERIAQRYTTMLRGLVGTPVIPRDFRSAWAQYTVLIDERDRVAAALSSQGIPTAIYYPKPVHQQTAYRHFPQAPGGLPVSERLARQVLSLPMHPYLHEAVQDRVVEALVAALKETNAA
jgi:dTDP-4-amino-4,6-dideoxygalactose transaminase